MDYRVVTLLAIMVTSCLCTPDPRNRSWASKCPCAKIYLPLCGSDGINYNNFCEFECHAKFIKQLFGKEVTILKEDLCDAFTQLSINSGNTRCLKIGESSG